MSPGSSSAATSVENRIDHRGRHHQPDRARLRELGDEVLQARGAGRAEAGEPRHGVRVGVVDDQVVPGLHQALDHVRAHAPKSDHARVASSLSNPFPRAAPRARAAYVAISPSPNRSAPDPAQTFGGASIGRGPFRTLCRTDVIVKSAHPFRVDFVGLTDARARRLGPRSADLSFGRACSRFRPQPDLCEP